MFQFKGLMTVMIIITIIYYFVKMSASFRKT